MPKLTEQEVNAIAGKLHRDLEEKLRLEKLRAIHEYIPSPEYLEFQANLKKIQDIHDKEQALDKEKDALGKRLNDILDGLGISRSSYSW